MKGNMPAARRRGRTWRLLCQATLAFAVVGLGASGRLLQGEKDDVAPPPVKVQPPFNALLATPEQRRQYIQGMSLVEKERLHRQAERFAELDAAEKRKLRRLQHDLATAADREELVAVMRSYQDWLGGLSPAERVAFLKLPPDRRITRIEHFNAEQRRRASDMEALAGWFERRMMEHLSPDLKRRISQLDSQRRRRRLAERWLQQRKGDRRSPILRMNETSFEELGKLLSKEARRELEKRSLQQKRQLLMAWINKFAEQYTNKIPPLELRRIYHDFTQEEREKFRREFSKLPPEEVRRRIELRYLEQHPYGASDFPGDRPFQRQRPATERPKVRDKPLPSRDRLPGKP